MAEIVNYMTNLSSDFTQLDRVDNLQNKIDKLERDLFKAQTQNKKLETQLKKTQETVAKYGKNNNNTSIPFFLPSEFKSNWEHLLKNVLMECYESFWESPEWLCHIVQDTFSTIYHETFDIIKSKLFQVLKILNVKELDDKVFERYLDSFRGIFQENLTNLFEFDQSNYKLVLEKLGHIPEQYDNFSSYIDKYRTDLMNNSYKDAIENMYNLSLYMILHEPILSLNIVNHKDREFNYFYFNKEKFISLEGFGKNYPCMVILNPPTINKKFPYQGMKAAVYILRESNSIINEICNKNQNEIKERNRLTTEEEEELTSIGNSFEKKETNNFPLKKEIFSPRSINIVIEDSNRKTPTKRNNITTERDDECNSKTCYDGPLSKIKNDNIISTSLNENNLHDSKDIYKNNQAVNEGDYVMNTESILLTSYNNYKDKYTEIADLKNDSFSFEKRTPFSQHKCNHKAKLSEAISIDSNGDFLKDIISKRMKNPLLHSKRSIHNKSMLKQKNDTKIINGKPYLLEFQSNQIKEVVSTVVKFPETKADNVLLKSSKNMKIKTPYNSYPLKKHENITYRNNMKKVNDSVESLYYGVNEKCLVKSNKNNQKSNKIYSFLLYNESSKHEDINPLKKKLIFSSRISKNILSTTSNEKKKKI